MDRLNDPMAPVNEHGNAFVRVDYGFADPDCVRCEGRGHVGFGSECEACECFVDDVHLTAGDPCPRREEA